KDRQPRRLRRRGCLQRVRALPATPLSGTVTASQSRALHPRTGSPLRTVGDAGGTDLRTRILARPGSGSIGARRNRRPGTRSFTLAIVVDASAGVGTLGSCATDRGDLPSRGRTRGIRSRGLAARDDLACRFGAAAGY